MKIDAVNHVWPNHAITCTEGAVRIMTVFTGHVPWNTPAFKFVSFHATCFWWSRTTLYCMLILMPSHHHTITSSHPHTIRPWPIILILLPIILYFYSQTFCLLFLLKVVVFFITHYSQVAKIIEIVTVTTYIELSVWVRFRHNKLSLTESYGTVTRGCMWVHVNWNC